MNSIDIIKQELINQKTILDSKGFTVETQGTYPSPAEITTTLNNLELNYDFTQATASEADVISGKTFFAGTSELRTGTFDTTIIDALNEKLNCIITGFGTCEIYIPEDAKYSTIREYAYSNYNSSNNPGLFYKENLVIPSNIREVGTRAFYKAQLTGKVTIPSTCELLESNAFQSSTMTEVDIHGGLLVSSTNVFSECKSLQKANIEQSSIETLANYLFSYDTALKEVYLPSTLTGIGSTAFYGCTKLNLVKFSRETPISLNTGVFNEARTATILVPYQSFHAYFTATNYQKYSNPMYGWGNFAQGDVLPTADADGLYTITWFTSRADLTANINPITTAPSDEMLYALFTAVATEEETETT